MKPWAQSPWCQLSLCYLLRIFLGYPVECLKKFPCILKPSQEVGVPWVVQWLGLHAFTAGATGSIPGRGTRIPKPSSLGQKSINQTSKKTPHTILGGECLQSRKLRYRVNNNLSQVTVKFAGRIWNGSGETLSKAGLTTNHPQT